MAPEKARTLYLRFKSTGPFALSEQLENGLMAKKPTYKELECRVRKLEKKALNTKRAQGTQDER